MALEAAIHASRAFGREQLKRTEKQREKEATEEERRLAAIAKRGVTKEQRAFEKLKLEENRAFDVEKLTKQREYDEGQAAEKRLSEEREELQSRNLEEIAGYFENIDRMGGSPEFLEALSQVAQTMQSDPEYDLSTAMKLFDPNVLDRAELGQLQQQYAEGQGYVASGGGFRKPAAGEEDDEKTLVQYKGRNVPRKAIEIDLKRLQSNVDKYRLKVLELDIKAPPELKAELAKQEQELEEATDALYPKLPEDPTKRFYKELRKRGHDVITRFRNGELDEEAMWRMGVDVDFLKRMFAFDAGELEGRFGIPR